MKHGNNPRRGRSRGGNGKRQFNPRNQTFESNGPDVKVRGTAQQVLEKYLALARDASSAGDRIQAESYLQYAEHYYRILSAAQAAFQGQGGEPQPQQPRSSRPDEVALDGELRTSDMDDMGEGDEGEEPEEVAERTEAETVAVDPPRPIVDAAPA
ncbi:MAG: DUF4167 domain-containing protein [Magnetospirillum sp. WYHS-4]